MTNLAVVLVLSIVGLSVSASAENQKETKGKFDGKVWLGKWESTNHTENLEAFVAQLGYPSAEHVMDHVVFQKFWQEGDHFHHKITVPSKNYTLDVQFKLGELGKGTFSNVEFKYLYTEQGDDLRAEISVPAKNKTVNDLYHVSKDGTELEKTYKLGATVAKRWYKRVLKQKVMTTVTNTTLLTAQATVIHEADHHHHTGDGDKAHNHTQHHDHVEEHHTNLTDVIHSITV